MNSKHREIASAFNFVKVTLSLFGNETQAFQIKSAFTALKSKSLQHAFEKKVSSIGRYLRFVVNGLKRKNSNMVLLGTMHPAVFIM